MYLGLGAVGGLDCLNPPCQMGGSIVVNGITVQLAPDVQVQGVGDNRILRRASAPNTFYGVYSLPPDFIVSGATPSSLYDSWTTRLQAEYEAAHPAESAAPGVAAGTAAGGGGLSLAGFGSNPLVLAAGAGLVLALLVGRRKGRH